jgi:hypothetical protein
LRKIEIERGREDREREKEGGRERQKVSSGMCPDNERNIT